MHLSDSGLVPQAGKLAVRAARMVARGSRWANPNQCHGLSGNIEFLLDMFQSTCQAAYYTESRSLATLLEAFALEQDGHLVWSSDDPEQVSPDYMVGYSGVLVCLLRLACPDHQPHQLSRRGFRYTSKKRVSSR